MRKFLFIFICCIISCGPKGSSDALAPIQAQLRSPSDWRLIPDSSSLDLTVVKDEGVSVEGHLYFSEGTITTQATGVRADLKFEWSSWDSGLALRDTRVREIIFGAVPGQNPTGQITADLKPELVEAIQNLKEESDPLVTQFDVTLNVFGKTLPISTSAEVSKKGERLFFKINEPVTVRISELGLAEPLKKLMEVCNHNKISDDVKVLVKAEFSH